MQKRFRGGAGVKIARVEVEPEVAAREQSCERFRSSLRVREEGESEDESDKESWEETEETAGIKDGKWSVKDVGNKKTGEGEEYVDACESTG